MAVVRKGCGGMGVEDEINNAFDQCGVVMGKDSLVEVESNS